MDHVAILADSTCDLPGSLKEKYNIGIIPLYVLLGERAFRDGLEIDPERIYQYFGETGNTPTTSAPSVEDFLDYFGPYARQGRDAVFFGISSEMSSSCQNAQLAVREIAGAKIRVVDSRNLSAGIGLLAVRAAEQALEGWDADRIAQSAAEAAGLVRASFVIDTLTYLYRGGRCTRLQMLGANALGLKPKIAVRDGRMGPEEKYRGRPSRVTGQYVADALRDLNSIDPARVFVVHSRCEPGIVESAVSAVRSAGYFRDVYVFGCGSVIASHCGPGTVGVMYMRRQV